MPMKQQEKEAYFREWLGVNKPILIKIAKSFTSNFEDFEELFQEIALQVWCSIPAFQSKSMLKTWVYRVAMNRALVWKRSMSKSPKKSMFVDISSIEIAHEQDSKAIQTNVIYSAIKKLTKSERALILMYLDGLSYKEISEVVEISESNVGVRLNRIKKSLLNIINGE